MARKSNVTAKNVGAGIIFVLVVAYIMNKPSQNNERSDETPIVEQQADTNQSLKALSEAYKNKQSDLQIQAKGVVERILPDDNKGSRHQRFILKLETNQTVLIAHNIDLAPRIEKLNKGDIVEFFGEYEWNDKGGVIHWTHHDPNRKHVDGWLKHNNKIYQ